MTENELPPSPYEEEFKLKFKLAWRAEERKLKRLKSVSSDLEMVKACKRFAARWDAKYHSRFSEYVVTDYEEDGYMTAFKYTGRVL